MSGLFHAVLEEGLIIGTDSAKAEELTQRDPPLTVSRVGRVKVEVVVRVCRFCVQVCVHVSLLVLNGPDIQEVDSGMGVLMGELYGLMDRV